MGPQPERNTEDVSMPQLPVKEGRLPELRLPEISREEIIRAFSEIKRPDFSEIKRPDFPELKRPDLDLSNVEWPKVDLSRLELSREDLDKAILGIATAARIVRPAVRSRRLPLGLGFLALASLVTFAILSRPSVRKRLAATASEARRRAEAARSGPEMLEIEADVLPDFEATNGVGIKIEPDAFKDAIEPAVAATATEASA